MLPDGVSSHDVRYNVINWVHRSTRGWSTGGSVTDPRTGEILKGVVTLGSLRWRQDYLIAEGLLSPYANGDEVPDDIADWALARIRQLSAHEVGHTLGLIHNYYDSELGRISVMDYPHPLVTLGDDGRLDYSEVYDVDIGEWDEVAIVYGYSVFPDGADEAAELERILDEAWDEDIILFTNQDIDVHARADQWSNGVDAAAELTRMMEVRRHALDRFGEAAIRGGRPIVMVEEALVPLYMHHRYQVGRGRLGAGGTGVRLRLPGRRAHARAAGLGGGAASGARRAHGDAAAGGTGDSGGGARSAAAPSSGLRPHAGDVSALHGARLRCGDAGGGGGGPYGLSGAPASTGGPARATARARLEATGAGRGACGACRRGAPRGGRVAVSDGTAARGVPRAR